jgi:hypothetical protein
VEPEAMQEANKRNGDLEMNEPVASEVLVEEAGGREPHPVSAVQRPVRIEE